MLHVERGIHFESTLDLINLWFIAALLEVIVVIFFWMHAHHRSDRLLHVKFFRKHRGNWIILVLLLATTLAMDTDTGSGEAQVSIVFQFLTHTQIGLDNISHAVFACVSALESNSTMGW